MRRLNTGIWLGSLSAKTIQDEYEKITKLWRIQRAGAALTVGVLAVDCLFINGIMGAAAFDAAEWGAVFSCWGSTNYLSRREVNIIDTALEENEKDAIELSTQFPVFLKM